MAKFFKSKKSKVKGSENVASPGKQQPLEAASIGQEAVEQKYFGKSLSYLSDEKKKLLAAEESLKSKEAALQTVYHELLEQRRLVSQEQQDALSDFNGASIEYFENELTSHPNAEENSGAEAVENVEQKKNDLQNMKIFETEKGSVCESLDEQIFVNAEELNAVRDELVVTRKTIELIDEAIRSSGEDELLEVEIPEKKPRKFKFNSKRRVANKVRGINFLNLPTFLRNDCEVEYGFLKLIINYVVVFIAIAFIGILYSLKLPYVLFLCLVYFVFGPSLIYFRRRKKYEKAKFATAVRYIETMIYSFTRNTKLLTALEETRIIMTGKVAEAIDYAIYKIRHGKAEADGDLYKEALKEIETVFPCTRIKNLHDFLIDVERDGGKHTAALDIMLEDAREWDVRTNNFQQEQTVKGMSMIISILMSLGVCYFMTNILPDDMGGDITGFALYQIITTVSLVVMFFIYRVAARKLTMSWVNDDLGEDAARLKADYKTVKAYIKNPSGKIKPVLALTRIKTAMDKAFPRWVTRFSLTASSKPIPVALATSVDKAPLVMKAELEKLNESLETDPNSIQPFVEFFDGFDLPQVRSMIMMVYSLASTDNKDIDKHILSMVKRNHLLQATAEKIEYDEKMAMFTLFSTVPMLLACVIMMIDVAMILFNMLNTVM